MRNSLFAVNLLRPADLGVDDRDRDHVEPGHGVRPEVRLPPPGDCDIPPGGVVCVFLWQTGGDHFVTKLDAPTVFDLVNVHHGNVVVLVRTNVEVFMEIHFPDGVLRLPLVLDLESVVAHPDVVELEVVPVRPETVGGREEVEGRDDDGATVVIGLAGALQSDAALPWQHAVLHTLPSRHSLTLLSLLRQFPPQPALRHQLDRLASSLTQLVRVVILGKIEIKYASV